MTHRKAALDICNVEMHFSDEGVNVRRLEKRCMEGEVDAYTTGREKQQG